LLGLTELKQSHRRTKARVLSGQSSWDQRHAVGAIHMHYSEITESVISEIRLDMPVVVYCWGPGCNGAHRGALNFALIGYQVKEMNGGFE
jgi:rhodanese-related sulfurtransferase